MSTPALQPAPEPLLRIRGAGKVYPGVVALAEADLDLCAGEVHALVGENGAGKSTLSRIIAGIMPPDSGAMFLRGGPFAPATRLQAEESGVRMVMQELNVIPTLTVAENIYLQRLPRRMGFVDYRQLNEDAAALMRELGFVGIAPDRVAGSLSIGQQQMVEIATALSRRCEVLVLDEPTAALTSSETEVLFARIGQLRNAGVGILYISHRMEEIKRLADRITVLRDGRVVGTLEAASASLDEIIRLMVGREIGQHARRRSSPATRSTGVPPMGGEAALSPTPGTPAFAQGSSGVAHRFSDGGAIASPNALLDPNRAPTAEAMGHPFPTDQSPGASVRATTSAPPPLLEVRHLSRPPAVRDVSFIASAGEILGFAGLMGSGRTETMRFIFGADRPTSGEVLLRGLPVDIRSPRDAVRLGIALLTEDRKRQGLLLPLDIAANATLNRLDSVSTGPVIRLSRETALAWRLVQALSIRCIGPWQRVADLSGGNQQKVVLARWLHRDCDVLIFDEPTRGIDIGAKFEIYRLLEDLAARGKAVIVISSDLLELMTISDRILVMSAGSLAGEFVDGDWTQDRIMSAALANYSAAGHGM